MSSWKAACETIHHLALALWLGAVVFAGAFAAIIFPTMKGLDPRLPDFAAYSGEHWRIAAGKVAQKGFLLADIVQFGCAIVAVASLLGMLVLFGLPRRRPATFLRALALGVALACAAGQIIIVAPQFNAAVKLYWAAAAVGDMQATLAHRAVTDRLHPIASWLLSGTAISVLIALTTGLWAMARPWQEPAPSTPRATPYPEPALRPARRP